ncbi:MAG: DegV family protein [Dehalococcoidia bacterium]|nr:DegV family protein [Dehalococcoidia bacterium]
MTVRVVTDSTADIPADVAEVLDIAVVPLHIHFGEETYEDGVTITSEEFYRRLTTEPHLPKTSAPASGTFTEVYERLARETDEIVSIHISSKLSATHSSALLGREAATASCRIEVIDSYSASIGLGLLAIRAARLAREGASLDTVVQDITAAIPRTHYFGVVDTLEYLHKGGRIGMATALLGSILKVKPLLGLRDGVAHPIERVRGRQKAFDRLCEMVAGYSGISSLAIAHTTAEEEMERLGARLAQFFPADRILRSRCGATLGTYLGPNTLCVALIREDAGNGPTPEPRHAH